MSKSTKLFGSKVSTRYTASPLRPIYCDRPLLRQPITRHLSIPMPRDLPPDIEYPRIPDTLSKWAIPLSKFVEKYPQYPRVIVGALIVRKSPDTEKLELLLLKRASTDSYPNFWEPPGGSVDPEDSTILHALVREAWEETGLRIVGFGKGRIVRDNPGEEGKGEVNFLVRNAQRWCKLNFLVQVQTGKDGNLDVILDDEEHQAWGWFDKQKVKELDFVSEQGREIALNAFKADAEN